MEIMPESDINHKEMSGEEIEFILELSESRRHLTLLQP